MPQQRPRIIDAIMPFIGLAIFILLMIVGFIFLSYLLIGGAIIGIVLYAIAWFKNKFSPQVKSHATQSNPEEPHHGRTIEYDEIDKD